MLMDRYDTITCLAYMYLYFHALLNLCDIMFFMMIENSKTLVYNSRLRNHIAIQTPRDTIFHAVWRLNG
jgi:hypothetical protein